MTGLKYPPQEQTRSIGLSGRAFILAGEFQMGSDQSCLQTEKPARTVWLDSYVMQEAPVTNAEFAAFVEATGYQTRAEKRGIGPNWLKAAASRADHPVVYVTWDDAVAYCNWRSLETGLLHRLPTEAEWEKAAKGDANNLYPWGDEHPNGRCGWNRPETLGTSPVRSYVANHYGLYDMAGNVWQWCADWYGESYIGAYSLNPAGPLDGTLRTRRGGAHNVRETFRLTCVNRGALESDEAVSNTGFRYVISAREEWDFRMKAETAFVEGLRAMVHDNGGAALTVQEELKLIAIQLVGTCRFCPSRASSAQALTRFIQEQLPEASVTCSVLDSQKKELIQLI